MKKELSKSEVQKTIQDFFSQSHFSQDKLRKIKRLAMKYKIKLSGFRRQFCKSCLSKLKGRVSITKTHKSVICSSCGFKNKFKI